MIRNEFVKSTVSTNALLWTKMREGFLPEGYVLYCGFQQAGKGQAGNVWESEAGRNLLFSMVLYPNHVPADLLFYVSQMMSVALYRILSSYISAVSIKWPNDIYVGDKKIAGVLIENSFQMNQITTVVGVGLNVNQLRFVSNAPNPVSLKQLTGRTQNRSVLLHAIWNEFMNIYQFAMPEAIRTEYFSHLYRKDGLHLFREGEEVFEASIAGVEEDGRILLSTIFGEDRAYYFKEVSFVQQ